MTDRLYYTDAYLIEVRAHVIASDDQGRRVTLDKTCFYPASGGQPHDTGTLNDIAVIDVVDEGDSIVHVLAAPLTDEFVVGTISWARRYDHMQQHTGQHLLSAVFAQWFQYSTLSFHMGDAVSTIELGTKEVTEQQIESVTQRATELARENPGVLVSFEDAAQAQGLRKSSDRQGILRIVEIPGIDRSACGGTHVTGLAEVLPLQIREMEKVRGNVRISFVCGDRAVRRAQADFQTLSRAALSLATSPEKLPGHISALKQNLSESEKQRQRLEAEAATRAGVDLYAGTQAGEDGIRRVWATEANLDENARIKARAFAAQKSAVILMHSGEGVLLACSADSGVNAGVLLKEALAKFGARGGGSPTLAQGSLPERAMLDDLRRAIGLAEAE